MQVFTVSFFGHRKINNTDLRNKLFELIYNLLDTKEYVELLVGRSGEFDITVASVINEIKKNHRDDNFELTLVLPYLTAEYLNNKNSFERYYDNIEICEKSANTHYKSAIQLRNREMVNRSDLVVFYLERNSGGAYLTYKKTLKGNKSIFLLKA